jgi:hypothetical protein
MEQHEHGNEHGRSDKVTIIVDKHSHTLSPIPTTGAELRMAVDVREDRDLYQELPRDDDVLIEPGSMLHLKNGDHFFTAPRNITPGQR